MVYFKDSRISSSNSQCLIISDHKGSKEGTRLLVGRTLIGQYATTSWVPLRAPLYLADWTLEYNSRPPKTWMFCTTTHRAWNVASTLLCLWRRIVNKETYWGNDLPFGGEFHYVPGYWEWAEDVLSRCRLSLEGARIYDAVYASLFTYDRNTNIMQAFCEAWCPVTNTLLTSVGELSISLWDLYKISGLPITGSPYEKVVPNVEELTGMYDKGRRFIPQTCEHLFDAFHRLRERGSNDPKVSTKKWVEF
uniref:Uncharacterized protein LOC104248035 n=1 Tax=Nicotiana sylvestris TaxID=4096 RepID=A0A1U7YUR5_NICSY|nr:PREDICTED: uncharacterized protein LOC104248035 [Nicotiana sylvestris]